MKQHYLILFSTLLLLSVTKITHAQNPDAIKTKEQNKKWLWDLEMLSLKEQIVKIQGRILADSSVYQSGSFTVRDQSTSENRPLYIVDDVPLTLCKETTAETLLQLNNLLSNATSIRIIDEEQATPIYGRRAKGGVITVQTGDKKSTDKIKQLKLSTGNCN